MLRTRVCPELFALESVADVAVVADADRGVQAVVVDAPGRSSALHAGLVVTENVFNIKTFPTLVSSTLLLYETINNRDRKRKDKFTLFIRSTEFFLI